MLVEMDHSVTKHLIFTCDLKQLVYFTFCFDRSSGYSVGLNVDGILVAEQSGMGK